MDQEKLKEVLSDEAFVKKLLAMEKPEDVQDALEDKGVEMSLDDIKQIGEIIRKVQSGEISQEQLERAADGELSEDELEGVSGGLVLTILGIVGIVFCAGAVATSAVVVTRATRGSW
jgi:hypothetical protein